MKDLYQRLGVSGPDATESEIRAALSRLELSESDRNDGAAVLLTPSRKQNYDKAWRTLRTVAELRANLGLSQGDNWTENDFRATTGIVSELQNLRDFLEQAAPGSDPHSSSMSRVLLLLSLVGCLFLILFQLQDSDSPSQSAPSAIPSPREVAEFAEPALATPATGTENRYGGNPVAPFEVKTSPSANYFVKLVDPATGASVIDVFIRGGERVQIDVPLGTFEMRYATGQTWYGVDHLFGPDTRYSKSDQLFTFSSDSQGIRGYTVELILQTSGNLRTRKIDASQF